MELPLCPFGSHRAGGALPQPAERLDATMQPYANEVLIEVEELHLDSSSMRQLAESCGGDTSRIAARIREIVGARGKMHNPVTGSGGILVGRAVAVGSEYPDDTLQPGETIATLVSLSLTPLALDAVHEVDVAAGRVSVTGKAILFASGLYARLPKDIPKQVALALCDIAGAPGTVAKITAPGQTVAVMGCGKAGVTSLFAARRALAGRGQLIALDVDPAAIADVAALGVADRALVVDLRDPIAAHRAVADATEGQLAELTVSATNAAGTEGAAILATRQRGRIYFFSMATSFTAAALTAEGLGRDVEMLIGNGYTQGWLDTAFALYRDNPPLAAWLRRRFGG